MAPVRFVLLIFLVLFAACTAAQAPLQQVLPDGSIMAASSDVPSSMQCIIAEEGKAVKVERPVPVPEEGQVLIKVASTAINRADTLQRKGKVPPPPGVTDILGLEAAGTVVGHGKSVDASALPPIGSQVMALLSGGGYAEYVTVGADQVMPVPEGMDIVSAGGVPETWLTAFQLLHTIAEVQAGDAVLVLAAGSGVGTAAIQLAVAAGAKPIAVAGSAAKLDNAAALGAIAGFNYKEGSYADGVKEATGGKGVDIILDCVGGSLWDANAAAIAVEGRWVLYGLLGGPSPEGPVLAHLMRKRIRLQATTLRARSQAYKANLVAGLTPLLGNFKSGAFSLVVDTVFDGLDKVQAAHDVMESNANMGKLIVKVHGS